MAMRYRQGKGIFAPPCLFFCLSSQFHTESIKNASDKSNDFTAQWKGHITMGKETERIYTFTDKELERLVQISARESIKAYISETEKIESNRHKREMSDLLQRYREIKATLRNTEGISSESDKKRPENERLIARIEKASDLFRIECERIGTPESARRFKVMQGLFLSDRAYSTPEIAEKYMVTTKCIYKDLSLIYERMAFYFARV